MIDLSKIDYSALDRNEITSFLFHPRPDFGSATSGKMHSEDHLIAVERDVCVGAKFYLEKKTGPSILFFHGNGEIVGDFEDIAEIFTSAGLNFLPVDYRGYGKSTGVPTVTAMMRDCHVIYHYARKRLQNIGFSGPFVVMGRSLGSASALELLSVYGDRIDGVIIESGFAYSETLLNLLGLTLKSLGLSEENGFRNIDKIRTFGKPTLIIHAEFDHILPFSEGQALYAASPARDKVLLKIPGADHNDIFSRGFSEYTGAVEDLAEKAATHRHADKA